ncbi:MAG: phosphohistidine phosphatase SixA [Gemmatimonadaceae bacterium]
MELLVIRHGAAMDKEEFARTGKSDDLRPLTSAGMEEMKEIARGLRELVKRIDLLVTSPLVRAVQTAEIVGAAYDIAVSETTDALSPDSEPKEFEKWAADSDVKRMAVVGHEPHLTALVSWLLTGKDDAIFDLKKGGMCLLEFDSGIESGSGILNWLLTPRQLTRIKS